LTFEEPLFPQLNESTVLLLCDGFGGSSRSVEIRRLSSTKALDNTVSSPGHRVNVDDWVDGSFRARLVDVGSECAELYTTLLSRPEVISLGRFFVITIGYVTGDNYFFHLTEQDAVRKEVPFTDLTLAVRRSSDLLRAGLSLVPEDALTLRMNGSHWLFNPADGLASGSAIHVHDGEKSGVMSRFKCRSRSPWYRVPGVRVPDMLMSVFSSGGPRLVENRAGVVAANSVLTLSDRPGSRIDHEVLAASSLTSLAQLGAEVEGHVLGGGALKFEPFEAKRWALPSECVLSRDELKQIDVALRAGRLVEARDLADQYVLVRVLGLGVGELNALRLGLGKLRALRKHRRTNRAGTGDPQGET
jgi:hypothetical protein